MILSKYLLKDMQKTKGRILEDNPLYEKMVLYSYTDNNIIDLKELYLINLKLINDWLNNTQETVNRVLNFFIIKNNLSNIEYTELKAAIYNNWELIKRNLLIIKTFLTDNYLFNYFAEYHSNNKVLLSCTSYDLDETLDENGNSKFIYKYSHANSNDINGIYSETFVKTRIELAFKKHVTFNNWNICNHKSEPCGEKTCPDHGWDILDPNGEKYGNLYIEVKTSRTNINEKGKLQSPSYSNAGKSNSSIEECFLPVIKNTNGIYELNPCFFTIIVFVTYCELEYIDNDKKYKVLQYYMSIPNMLQLSIEYKKNIDGSIGIQRKSNNNNNTILRPTCQKWITTDYGDIYEFIKSYQKEQYNNFIGSIELISQFKCIN